MKKNFTKRLKKVVHDNPLPTTIAGLGIACTIGQAVRAAFRKPPEPPTLTERCGAAAASAKDKVEHAADVAKEKVHHAAEAVAEKVAEVKDSIATHAADLGDSAKKTKGRAKSLVSENPYLCSAGVAATGFLVGLLIPPTRFEKEWLGTKGRQLIDEAKATGHEAVEEVKAIAKETVAAADQAVRDAAEASGETLREKLASV